MAACLYNDASTFLQGMATTCHSVTVPTGDRRLSTGPPLLIREDSRLYRDMGRQGRLDHCLHTLMCCLCIIRSPERLTMMQTKGVGGILVLKATNNGSYAANAGISKGSDRRAPKKGSRVTEARAIAQRAKLDAQAEARYVQEEQEAVARQTPNKKSRPARDASQRARHLNPHRSLHPGSYRRQFERENARVAPDGSRVDESLPEREVGYHPD
jgi:hypothetical protein